MGKNGLTRKKKEESINDRTIQERFEAKFTKSNGCWEWEAGEFRDGYGAFGFAGRTQKAHRVAYQLYVGEIPTGMCVCHHCNNRRCVNPDHLFLRKVTESIQDRFESKLTKSDGCWEWNAFKMGSGYGQFGLAGHMQYAHRVSYQLYIGEIPTGLYVCHKCDNPGCVNPAHLFLGTPADNVHDCENKGRGFHPGAPGTRNGHAKLTEVQVIEIRAKYGEGVRIAALAKEFGVSRRAIYHIVYHTSWAKI